LRLDTLIKKTSLINEDAPMPKLKVSLLTGRTIDQGKGKEYGKLSREYWESVTICFLDPEDLKFLEIKENENIKVTTKSGSVVMKAVKSARTPHPRIAFIPYGPWASIIMNQKTHGTGMPSLKGIPAEIEPAPEEKVLSLSELLNKHYKVKKS
jgi:formylmethanofuran dehydrogenase subunit D